MALPSQRGEALALVRVVVSLVVATARMLGSSGAGLAQTIDESLWVANGSVEAVVRDGKTIYIGGGFTQVGPAAGGGVARNYIAALDATSGAATAWNPNASYYVAVLAVSNSTVYAGGYFTSIGGQARNYIAALDATSGAATAWNPNANGPIWALAVSGATVYVGGPFTSIGGQVRNHVAALDATTGEATAWNPNANGEVDDLVASGSTVYAAGSFTSIGGQARNYIAALDATTGAATAWNPNANAQTWALAVGGFTIYAGGNFDYIGGRWRNQIAALDATTGAATDWDPNVSNSVPGPSVNALVVSGSTVYAGGHFRSIGGQARNNIAALDTVIGTATAWNPNASGEVYALAMSGSTVYAGGSFLSIGGLPQSHIAAIEAPTVDVSTGSGSGSVARRLEILPNPFEASTKISFAIRSEARVTLEVLDVAGRVVATLLRDEHVPAGFHEVEFRHPRLPSGLYVSRLQAGRDILTRKMLVLK